MYTASRPSVSYIDFAKTPLAKWYSGSYALVIDNLLSPEECEDLISLAESTESEDGVGWQVAKVAGPGIGNMYLNTSYRNSDRILRFDDDAARQLYDRVLPFVEEDIIQ
jgi:hypothetical protein